MNHIHKSNALIKLALHFHRSRRKKESAWKFPKLPGSTFRRFFLFFFSGRFFPCLVTGLEWNIHCWYFISYVLPVLPVSPVCLFACT